MNSIFTEIRNDRIIKQVGKSAAGIPACFIFVIIEDICAKNDGSCQWIDNGDTFDSVVMLRYQ